MTTSPETPPAPRARRLVLAATVLVVVLPLLAPLIPFAGVLDAEFAYLAALALCLWGVVAGWELASVALLRGDVRVRAGRAALAGLALCTWQLLVMGALTRGFLGCRLGHGPGVVLIMILPAPILGIGLGAAARGWGRTRLRALVLLLVAAALLLVLPGAARFAFLQRSPHSLLFGAWGLVSVFGYQAWDVLTRDVTLMHRAFGVAWAALLIAVADAGLRRRRGTPGGRRERRALALAAALVLLLALGWDRTGVGLGRSRLDRALAGRLSEDAVTVRFSPDVLDGPGARRLLDDALWHRRDLALRMDLAAPPEVTLWAFSGRQLRRGSVGLSYGNLAAPWLGEAVIVIDTAGRSPTLRHELVHLLAASWAGPPLWVPLDSGRTEGLARALERGRDRGGPHQRTFAAALAQGTLPEASSFLGFGNFWLGGQNVRNAYDLAGSFVGFLLERKGVAAVERWYGGASVESAFGCDLSTLDVEWREYLAQVPIDLSARRLAEGQLGRQAPAATHARRCVRLVAASRARRSEDALDEAWSDERWDDVVRELEASPEDAGDPASTPFMAARRAWKRAVIAFQAYSALGRPGEAASFIERSLLGVQDSDPRLPGFLRLLLIARLSAGLDGEALDALDVLRTTAPEASLDLVWVGEILEDPRRDRFVAMLGEPDPARRRADALRLWDEGGVPTGFGIWTWSQVAVHEESSERARSLGAALLRDGGALEPAARAAIHGRLAGLAEDDEDLEAALDHARRARDLENDEGRTAALDELVRRLAWRVSRRAAQSSSGGSTGPSR